MGLFAVVMISAVAGYSINRTSLAATDPADVNGDNIVNVTDLSLVLSSWGKTTVVEDVNRDGIVNVFDLSILLSHWGNTSSPSPVPTATTIPTTTTSPTT